MAWRGSVAATIARGAISSAWRTSARASSARWPGCPHTCRHGRVYGGSIAELDEHDQMTTLNDIASSASDLASGNACSPTRRFVGWSECDEQDR